MKVSELLESKSMLPELPQEVVGKSASTIAKALEPNLRKAGVPLDKAVSLKDDKTVIFSVKTNKLKEGQTAYLHFYSSARGGRGVNKPRNLALGFSVRDAEGNVVQMRGKSGGLHAIVSITYEGAFDIYKDFFA